MGSVNRVPARLADVGAGTARRILRARSRCRDQHQHCRQQPPRVLGLVVDLATRRRYSYRFCDRAARGDTEHRQRVLHRADQARLGAGSVLDTLVKVNDPALQAGGVDVVVTDLGVEQTKVATGW